VSYGYVGLYTDTLVYALVAGCVAGALYARKREYWRVAFRQIVANKIAMVSFGIVCCYAAVGLVDSIHVRAFSREGEPRGEVVSLLDLVCRPLGRSSEKTYSAPFAVRSLSKENVRGPDGAARRAFPRLTFAGSHLGDGADARRGGDIAWRAFLAVLVTFVLAGAYVGVVMLVRRRFAPDEKRARAVLRAGLWVAGFLSCLTFLIAFVVSMTLGRYVEGEGYAVAYHIFGTDKAGADVLYQAIKGIRAGLVIGTLTTIIVTPLAILFGVLAGYFGGWVDSVIQYVYTTLSSIPSILLIVAGMLILNLGAAEEETIFTSDKRLLYLCCVMGVTSWTGLCRLIRGEVFKLREVEYVQAADALGVRSAGIMVRHLVPNVMHIVLITVVLRFSGLVLAEAFLAYIGVGVDPSMSSWGNMINAARLELARDPVVWWQLAAAFAFTVGLVLPANLLGDAVQDALDPKLRTR